MKILIYRFYKEQMEIEGVCVLHFGKEEEREKYNFSEPHIYENANALFWP